MRFRAVSVGYYTPCESKNTSSAIDEGCCCVSLYCSNSRLNRTEKRSPYSISNHHIPSPYIYLLLTNVAITKKMGFKTSTQLSVSHRRIVGLLLFFVTTSSLSGIINGWVYQDVSSTRTFRQSTRPLGSTTIISMSSSGGSLHGQNSCFLPLKQLDQDYYAPRIVQVRGMSGVME